MAGPSPYRSNTVPDATLTKVTVLLTSDELAALNAIAASHRKNKTEAVRQMIRAATSARQPGLAGEVWEALASAAKRRLRRALSEAELETCLDVTNSWLVTGADAPLIHIEIADGGDELGAPHGVDTAALATKLEAMADIDRAVLAVACRGWWASAEPRPPLATILGGQLRGPGLN